MIPAWLIPPLPAEWLALEVVVPGADVLVVSREADRLAAERLVSGDEGRPPRYQVVSIDSVTAMERWPGARTVILWHSGTEDSATAMHAVGERLHGGTKTVKYLVGPSAPDAIEGGITDWTAFLPWAKPLIREWSNGAFQAAVAEFSGRLLPEHDAGAESPTEPLREPEGGSPDEPVDPAEVAFFSSLDTADVSAPEPEAEGLQPEHSVVFAAPQREGWAQPLDFWGDASSLPEVPFGCLPPAVAPYLFDQSALRGVDPCQAAISCVVACSALIRESIYLQMMADSHGWQEHSRLFGAVIGDPSTRKGVGITIGEGQMKHLALNFRAAEDRAIAEYAHEDKIYQGKLADYYRDAKKNPLAARPNAPERPMSNRLWTDDGTLDGIAKLLSSHKRGKICVCKDELASWFGSFDAFSNGKTDRDRPTYLSAYEGGERYVDRATEGKSYHVPTFSLCVLGGIQPSTLAAIANKLGSDGMLQRFMLATSRTATRSEERKPDTVAQGRWQALCSVLLDMELHPSGPVRFSPEAQDFRRECSDWFDGGMGAGFSPGMAFWLGKTEGLLGRLALTFHCVESADQGKPFPEPFISYSTAERAFSYIKDFLFPHALQFYEVAQADSDGRVPLKKIAGLLLIHTGATITRADIGHAWTGWRKLQDAQKRETMSALCEAGWLRALPSGVHWEINPQARSGFADMAQKIRTERAAQAALIPVRGFKPGREPGSD